MSDCNSSQNDSIDYSRIKAEVLMDESEFDNLFGEIDAQSLNEDACLE